MTVRQTACRHCGLDIENFSPYRKGEWRDRGNNTHCNDGRHAHAPIIEARAPVTRAPRTTRTKRPTILTSCTADRYAAPTERIVEFSFPSGSGGLISFRTLGDGRDVIDIYRTDASVHVLTSSQTSEYPTVHAASDVAACLDGQEWTADTLDRIATVLRAAGFTIREPEEAK